MGALCLTARQSEPPSDINDSSSKLGRKHFSYSSTNPVSYSDIASSGKVVFISGDPSDLAQGVQTNKNLPLRNLQNNFQSHSSTVEYMPEKKFPVMAKVWKEGAVYTAMQVDQSTNGGHYTSDPKFRVTENGKLSFFPKTGSSSEFEQKDVINWVPSRQPSTVDVFPDDSSIRVYEQSSLGTNQNIAVARKRTENMNPKDFVVYERGPAGDKSPMKQFKSPSVEKAKEEESKKLMHHLMIMKQEREKLRDLGSHSPSSDVGSVFSPSKKTPPYSQKQSELHSKYAIHSSDNAILDSHLHRTANDMRVSSNDTTPSQRLKTRQDQIRIQRIKNLLNGQNTATPPTTASLRHPTSNNAHRNVTTQNSHSAHRSSERIPHPPSHNSPLPHSEPTHRHVTKTSIPRHHSDSAPAPVSHFRSPPVKNFPSHPSALSPTSPIEIALPVSPDPESFEFPSEAVFSSDYADSIPSAQYADAQDLVFIEAPTVKPISLPLQQKISSNHSTITPESANTRKTGAYDSIPVAQLRFSHTPPGTDTEVSDSEALFGKTSRFRSVRNGQRSISSVRDPLVYEESSVVEFSSLGINNESFQSMDSNFSDFVPIAELEEEGEQEEEDRRHEYSPADLAYVSSMDDGDIYVAQAVEAETVSDSPFDSRMEGEGRGTIPVSAPVYSSRSPKEDGYGRGRVQEGQEVIVPTQKFNLMPFHPKPVQPFPLQGESNYLPSPSPSPRPSTPPQTPPATAAATASDDLYNPSAKKLSKMGGWFFKSKDKSSMNAHTANILQRSMLDIREHYLIYEEELGRGRFGIIHVCICRETGQRLACKSIRKSKLKCPQDVEDVRREVKVMEMLRGHPHVVHLKDTFEDSRFVHLVMELCEGGELFDRIKMRARYSEPKARSVIRTVVEVLEHCHSLGIMHRDLKPENILLCNWESDTTVKVIDYGVAALFRKGKHCTDIAGSPFYLAPEVLKEKYGPEADVWSAGVVLYILLSGVPPFWAPSNEGIFEAIKEGKVNMTREPWPRISSDAKDLVSAMLTKDPKRRISVDEILAHPWLN